LSNAVWRPQKTLPEINPFKIFKPVYAREGMKPVYARATFRDDFRNRPKADFQFRATGLVPVDYTSLPPAVDDCEELIYLAAAWVALKECFEWWVKDITGKKGRPKHVSPYRLNSREFPHIFLMPPEHRAHSFRLWLTRDLAVDRGGYLHEHEPRWNYAGDEPYSISLEPNWSANEGGAEMLGHGDDRATGPLETMADHRAANPELVVAQAFPFAAEVLLRAQALLSHVDGYVPAGWSSFGSPPLNRQPGRPLDERTRRAIRDQQRAGLFRGATAPPTFAVDAKGRRRPWMKANPRLKAGELRAIKRAVRELVQGPNIPSQTDMGWGWPRTQAEELEAIRVVFREAAKFECHHYDPFWGQLVATEGSMGSPKKMTIEEAIAPRTVKHFKSPRDERQLDESHRAWQIRIAGQPATIAKKGAVCSACAAFMPSPQTLDHHDCITYLASKKGLNLSTAAIGLIRSAVHAETEPILRRLDELFSLVVDLHGNPVDEAERILADCSEADAA
jgi:hypothetical protein